MPETTTPIPLSGTPFFKGNGLVFDEITGGFYFSAELIDPTDDRGIGITELYTLSIGGAVASVGATDAYFGGMAFSYQVPVELQSFSIE